MFFTDLTAEFQVVPCFFCRINSVRTNIHADPIKWIPCDVSPSHTFFPNIFHIHSETAMHSMQISVLRSFRSVASLWRPQSQTVHFQGQVWIIDRWRFGQPLYSSMFISNFDTIYKSKSENIFWNVDGKYTSSVFYFNGFPRDIHTSFTLLSWIRPSYGWFLSHSAVS